MFVETSVGDHGTIKFEVDTPSGMVQAGGKKTAERAGEMFDESLSIINTVAGGVQDTVNKMDNSKKPHEVEVDFGIKLSTEVGAIIAKAGAEAHLNVKLTWKLN